MTAATQTVSSYLTIITDEMNKEETPWQSRELAAKHIKETLKLTAIQFQLSYDGLKTLDSVESVQKHVKVLETSLSDIATKCSAKFTESDSKRINEGLTVLNKPIDIKSLYHSPSPRFWSLSVITPFSTASQFFYDYYKTDFFDLSTAKINGSVKEGFYLILFNPV